MRGLRPSFPPFPLYFSYVCRPSSENKNHGDANRHDQIKAALTGALNALICAHKKGVASLGIYEDKLNQFGVDGEVPVQLWEQDVPAKCMLREAAIRVL